MLRLFQIIATTGLLGLTWLVFSADSVDKAHGEIKKSSQCDRKSPDQTSGSFSGSSKIDHENRADLRTLDQLLGELASVQKATEDANFSKDGLCGVAAEFITGLNAIETELLLRHLLGPTHLSTGRDFWRKELILRFGKLDPDAGFVLAEELEGTDDEISSDLEAYLFLSWTSVKPLKASKRFRKFRETKDDGERDPF